MDSLMTLLGTAGVNFLIAVPGADDVMLNYQSLSYHDVLGLRHLLHRRPAPDFAVWLGRMGLLDDQGRMTPPAGASDDFRRQLGRATGRGRVWATVEIAVGVVYFNKKTK